MIDNELNKPKESLSFVQQLQNQLQLCREAMSDITIPLSPKVEALESFLWAKLKDDLEYNATVKELDNWYIDKTKDLKDDPILNKKESLKKNYYKRARARERFKAIMIFIDKKGLMPLGDENER